MKPHDLHFRHKSFTAPDAPTRYCYLSLTADGDVLYRDQGGMVRPLGDLNEDAVGLLIKLEECARDLQNGKSRGDVRAEAQYILKTATDKDWESL